MSGLTEKHRDWLDAALTYESEYSFEDAESRKTARELLLAALRELDPKDRAVIELVHLEERSVAEAAELLGWSRSNVKVRAFRSRKKLRKVIENMSIR
jgi:RNA polymerase sigma-70 factor (ECF subfamily)